MDDIEILVFKGTKRIAAAVVKDNGIVLSKLRDGRNAEGIIMPLADGESVWEVVERAAGTLVGLDS
jgi:hypothetical protein